jgi:hypothetical protein
MNGQINPHDTTFAPNFRQRAGGTTPFSPFRAFSPFFLSLAVISRLY